MTTMSKILKIAGASFLISTLALLCVPTFAETPAERTQSARPGNTTGSESHSNAGSVLPMNNSNDGTGSGKSSVRTLVDDSILTTKIKAGMLADPGVKATEVSVETNSGEVTLSGAVASQPEVEQAQKIAEGVNGVKTVINKLTLKK